MNNWKMRSLVFLVGIAVGFATGGLCSILLQGTFEGSKQEPPSKTFSIISGAISGNRFEMVHPLSNVPSNQTYREVDFSKLADTDVNLAIRLMYELKDKHARYRAIEAIVAIWTINDLTELLKYVEKLPGGEEKAIWQERIFKGIGKVNIARGAAYFDTLPANVQDACINVFISDWAGADPKGAGKFVINHTGLDLIEPLNIVIENWRQEDLYGCIDWVKGTSEGGVRTQLLSALCFSLALEDAPTAAELVDEFSGLEYKRTVTAVSESWARKDPNGALKWFEGLNGDAQDSAIVGLVRRWSYNYPRQCEDWIKNLPEGNLRDRAISTIADARAIPNILDAILWVIQTSNGRQKDTLLRRLASKWLLDDREAASNWISTTSDLSDQARKDLSNE